MSTVPGLVRIKVTIEGLPPGMIQQSKGLMAADEGVKKKPTRTREEEARLHAHWTRCGVGKQKEKDICAIPWVALYKSICAAAGDFKWKGKKMMSSLVASTISCEQDMIPLECDGYEVYVDWVRIPPRTGAVVKIGRPRFRDWKATFILVVDPESYKDVKDLNAIIVDAGKLIGIGAWRPQLKGPYGRFAVTAFDIQA